MKKLFLSLSLCLAAITSAQATDWTDDNGVTWSYSLINDNTEVRITGVSNYPTDLTVPAAIDGKTVTQLGDPGMYSYSWSSGVFDGKTNIASISLPSTVSAIGTNAFRNSSLESINLSSCAIIGGYAFSGCSNLSSVDLSSGTRVGYASFQSCTSLANVGNLSSCESIDSFAFSNCTSLVSIDLSSFTSISGSAFKECINLVSVGDLSSCTSIGSSAFQRCTSLVSVNLSSCTSIGSSAFISCKSLAEVGNLSSCKSIGDNAFNSCTSLVDVGNLSSCTSIEHAAFYNCTSLVNVGDLSSCTSIGSSVFYNCASLESVDLSSCTNIEYSTFYNCTSLVCVGDLSSFTSIGYSAFHNCASLESVDLSSCISLGHDAFSGCASLTSLGDLSSCTSIGENAFNGCLSLTRINVASTVPPMLSNVNAFSECTSVIVPAANLADYKAADVWKDMALRIIADNVQTVYDVKGLRAMDQGSTLQDAIGEANLANVMDLKMSGSINGYDIMVMRNKMHNLHIIDMTDVNIVANDYYYYERNHTETDVLGPYAFYNLRKLTSIALPNSIRNIGYNAFRNDEYLRNIRFSPNIQEIGISSFEGCSRLKSITLPNGLLCLRDYAFRSCGSLSEIVFPNSLSKISYHAFSYCWSLTEIELPPYLQEIGEHAFYQTKLNKISLPASIVRIGDGAFYDCPIADVYSKLVDPFTIGQNTFSTWTTATLHVPMTDEWKTTYNKYYWDTQWSQFAHIAGWDPTIENFYIDNDYELNGGQVGHGQDNGDGSTSNSPSADLNNGSGFIVSDDGEQNFDDVHIKGDGSSSGSLIGENIHANNLHIDINVTKGKWYFFAFPFNVALANVEAPGNYVFREYDGKERADNGRGGWKNLPKDQEYLYAGKGYIFQTNKDGVLTLPVEHPDFSALKDELALDTHSAANAQDASWNFVGNPFLSYYDIDEIDFDAPITIWNGSGYDAVRPGDDDYRLYPYQAFFVQKPSAADLAQIGFDLTQQETKKGKKAKSDDSALSPVAARRIAKANSNRKLINLMVSDGTYTDKTRVVFNDESSMDYEMACDAAKFMSSENVPQLYSTYNSVNYQINERPNGSREVSLGFTAKQNGTYTIEAARMDVPMALKDLVTGIVFDLSDGAYSFESQAGTFDNRFVLMDMSKAPTGIEGVEEASHYAKAYDLNGRQLQQPQQGVQLKEGKKVVVM